VYQVDVYNYSSCGAFYPDCCNVQEILQFRGPGGGGGSEVVQFWGGGAKSVK
jgi:hypothetical protein